LKSAGALVIVIEFIKKYKERVALVAVGLAFIFFIAGGIYLQKKNKREKIPIEVPPIVADIKDIKTEQKEIGKKSTELIGTNTTYFIKPSPEELLEQLASMENLNEDVVEAKFSQFPVLWPGYFFTVLQKENNRTSLLLDVSEDGFGVVLESEVDLAHYPQLRELERGQKIWIGGKILAVDPAGTGTIYLETEELRFGPDAPFSAKPE
jgi:uncharacterized protein YneF (UPF0154 family)